MPSMGMCVPFQAFEVEASFPPTWWIALGELHPRRKLDGAIRAMLHP